MIKERTPLRERTRSLIQDSLHKREVIRKQSSAHLVRPILVRIEIGILTGAQLLALQVVL